MSDTPNYSGTSMGWAQEAVQKIAELQRERDRLQRELQETKAEVAACLRFLRVELDWEYFRAEMLYHDDEEKKTTTESNAQQLRNYLAESGHGVDFLQKHESLERDRDALLAALAQMEPRYLREVTICGNPCVACCDRMEMYALIVEGAVSDGAEPPKPTQETK